MPQRRRSRIVLLLAALLALLPAAGLRAQERVLKVGIIFSYSNSGPPIGKELDAAIAAYQKEHGETVAGWKVEFLRRDDTGVAPEIARRLAQELVVQDRVQILAGLMFTPNAIAAGEISTQSKTPLVISNAATSGILAKNPYMVRFSHTETQTTVPLAQWAARNGIKSVYSVYLDFGPGIEASGVFGRAFEAAGGRIAGALRVPLSTKDYAPYLQRVKDANPDAIFAFVGPIDGGRPFLHAYEEAGLAKAGIRLLATGDLVVESNLPSLGDVGIGIISSSVYSASHNSRLNRTFIADYVAAGGPALPDYSGAAAYDTVAAIYKAIAAQHGSFDPEKTVELLRHLAFESPRGPIAIDPATRDIVQNVYIRRTVRQNGQLVNVEIATIPMVKDPGVQ